MFVVGVIGIDIVLCCGYEYIVYVVVLNVVLVLVLLVIFCIVVLFDIYGQYGLLVCLLCVYYVIDVEDCWVLGKDMLVIVGDVFDRGLQVIEVFWLFYGLQQQVVVVGGVVYFVFGNYEIMVLYDDLCYVNFKYLCSVQLLGCSYLQLYGVDLVIGQWLCICLVLLKIGDILFLYGGILFEVVQLVLDLVCINVVYQVFLGLFKVEVKVDLVIVLLYDGKISLIWYRGYFDGCFDIVGVQVVFDCLQFKCIVVGYILMLYVSSFYGDCVIVIDSSIKNGENGELLFIEDGKFSCGLLDGFWVLLVLGELGLQD